MTIKACIERREEILAALYQELDEPRLRDLMLHLHSCAGCAEAYSSLAETIRILTHPERVEPPEQFWHESLGRLEKRIRRDGKRLPGFLRGGLLHPAMRIAAAAALVLVGIWIGRVSDQSDSGALPEIAEVGEPNGEDLPPELQARVERYLGRTKIILLGLGNMDPNHEDVSRFDFTPEKRVGRELMLESIALRQELAEFRQRRMLELISELEIILLQISNLNAGGDAMGVDVIKTGIDRGALLFKINLEEMRRSRSSGSHRSVG